MKQSWLRVNEHDPTQEKYINLSNVYAITFLKGIQVIHFDFGGGRKESITINTKEEYYKIKRSIIR